MNATERNPDEYDFEIIDPLSTLFDDDDEYESDDDLDEEINEWDL